MSSKNENMKENNLLSWQTAHVLTRVLCLCLLPLLFHDSEYKYKKQHMHVAVE